MYIGCMEAHGLAPLGVDFKHDFIILYYYGENIRTTLKCTVFAGFRNFRAFGCFVHIQDVLIFFPSSLGHDRKKF